MALTIPKPEASTRALHPLEGIAQTLLRPFHLC